MSDAYRDDLEAALARASDLEREIAELRARNAGLEANPAARDHARQPAAALDAYRRFAIASLLAGVLGALVAGVANSWDVGAASFGLLVIGLIVGGVTEVRARRRSA
jgi:hypothetical protein